MKQPAVTISLLLLTSSLCLARMWTDTTGREVEADVVKVNPNRTAVFKTNRGKTVTVPFSAFVAADVAYLESLPTGDLHAEERRLPLLGVSPYSEVTTMFYDESGREFNFLALAHHGGANTTRVRYYGQNKDNTMRGLAKDGVEGNRILWDRMEIVKELGLRTVCTLMPSKPNVENRNFRVVLARIEKEAKESVQDFKKRGYELPKMYTIGNEINHGGMNDWCDNKVTPKLGDKGSRYYMTEILKAAARGLRAGGFRGYIGVHIDRTWAGFYHSIIEGGFTDWQVIAQSFYPRGKPNDTMARQMERLHGIAKELDKKIFIMETAAPYVLSGTPESRARSGHTGAQDFHPDFVREVSPQGQAWHVEDMCELLLDLPDERGLGLLTWGSDCTAGIHRFAIMTWNRAQVTKERVALPSIYSFGKYAEPLKSHKQTK
ncbi:MAG: glycosyl hydrolase 53 family protein [Desulfuromonadales bacterium]|nr:glycosyl hydrolase 53 family protein [Desulfuromonadales bacterium]